jgi:hypothetical protein
MSTAVFDMVLEEARLLLTVCSVVLGMYDLQLSMCADVDARVKSCSCKTVLLVGFDGSGSAAMVVSLIC